jgi:putative spermidine/putrescine transport system ATP-binding protein
VTHDQEEALSISDRIVVMNGGIAEQVGRPFDVYNRPATSFVANFVGTLNLFRGTLEAPVTGVVRLGETMVELGRPVNRSKGAEMMLALRPEAIRAGKGEGQDILLKARILDVNFLGSVIRIRAEAAGTKIKLDTFNRSDAPPPPAGSEIDISLSAADFILLDE